MYREKNWQASTWKLKGKESNDGTIGNRRAKVYISRAVGRESVEEWGACVKPRIETLVKKKCARASTERVEIRERVVYHLYKDERETTTRHTGHSTV